MYRAVFKVVFVALSLSLAVSSLASASVVTEYFAYSGAQFGKGGIHLAPPRQPIVVAQPT